MIKKDINLIYSAEKGRGSIRQMHSCKRYGTLSKISEKLKFSHPENESILQNSADIRKNSTADDKIPIDPTRYDPEIVPQNEIGTLVSR